MSRQSGQKFQRLYGNPTANNIFQNRITFTKFVNRYVKILDGRFYSPRLKDVVIAWLERAQFIFVIFHTTMVVDTDSCCCLLKKQNQKKSAFVVHLNALPT